MSVQLPEVGQVISRTHLQEKTIERKEMENHVEPATEPDTAVGKWLWAYGTAAAIGIVFGVFSFIPVLYLLIAIGFTIFLMGVLRNSVESLLGCMIAILAIVILSIVLGVVNQQVNLVNGGPLSFVLGVAGVVGLGTVMFRILTETFLRWSSSIYVLMAALLTVSIAGL